MCYWETAIRYLRNGLVEENRISEPVHRFFSTAFSTAVGTPYGRKWVSSREFRHSRSLLHGDASGVGLCASRGPRELPKPPRKRLGNLGIEYEMPVAHLVMENPAASVD